MATATQEATTIHHGGTTPGRDTRAAIVDSLNRRLAAAIDAGDLT